MQTNTVIIPFDNVNLKGDAIVASFEAGNGVMYELNTFTDYNFEVKIKERLAMAIAQTLIRDGFVEFTKLELPQYGTVRFNARAFVLDKDSINYMRNYTKAFST